MPYTLTLTRSERDAFEFVSYRYNAGEVYDLIVDCDNDSSDMDSRDDITFEIPEHVAWEIRWLAEEESYAWPCFSAELANKLNHFINTIV